MAVAGLSLAGTIAIATPASANLAYKNLGSYRVQSTGTSLLGHMGIVGNKAYLATRAKNGNWSTNTACYAKVGVWY